MHRDFRLAKWRGKYAAEWYDETGRRFRRSLGTSDRSEAKRLLNEEFIPALERAARPTTVTVKYCWDTYREALGEKPAAVTMSYEWKAIGPHFGEMLATAITEKDCTDYIAKRRSARRKDGTIWTELGHLRSALSYAAKRKVIAAAPPIYRPKRPEPRDRRMTREEVKRFLDACEFHHIKLFAVLAITTAARATAILDLTWDRVDFKTGIIRLADPERARTNKGRATVPMNATLRSMLTEAYQGSTCDYVIEWASQRVHSVKKGLKAVGKRTELPWVTAHVFRHSAACLMAEDGVPMAEIAQYLGHSDSRITERVYARFSPSYLRKAAAALEFDLVHEAKRQRK